MAARTSSPAASSNEMDLFETLLAATRWGAEQIAAAQQWEGERGAEAQQWRLGQLRDIGAFHAAFSQRGSIADPLAAVRWSVGVEIRQAAAQRVERAVLRYVSSGTDSLRCLCAEARNETLGAALGVVRAAVDAQVGPAPSMPPCACPPSLLRPPRVRRALTALQPADSRRRARAASHAPPRTHRLARTAPFPAHLARC